MLLGGVLVHEVLLAVDQMLLGGVLGLAGNSRGIVSFGGFLGVVRVLRLNLMQIGVVKQVGVVSTVLNSCCDKPAVVVGSVSCTVLTLMLL